MKLLIQKIQECTVCQDFLEYGVNPVLDASVNSKIAIIGQAPGSVVHRTGIPWDDKSGERLREWLDVDKKRFYNTNLFAIIPMGFCYPGKGKTGDLPPRKECAPLWHQLLLDKMPKLELILLIGSYAQSYYLGNKKEKTLTDTVKKFDQYAPQYFPLPHPSPRNNIWMAKNPWFEIEVLPTLRMVVRNLL